MLSHYFTKKLIIFAKVCYYSCNVASILSYRYLLNKDKYKTFNFNGYMQGADKDRDTDICKYSAIMN